MNRLLILAALLLSVVGGLTLMSSSSPLAAQTGPSANRSFDPTTVEPGGMVTVGIDIEGITGQAGSVTETLPEGFTYVSDTTGFPQDAPGSEIEFTFLGNTAFSYVVTASSVEGSYSFSGTLNPGPDEAAVDVSGPDTVTVSANSAPTIAGDAEVDYAENGTGDVATYTANDPDDDTITWSLSGADADDFSLASGVLSFVDSPNYESPADADGDNAYMVTLTVADPDGESDSIDVTITVTNVGPAPVVVDGLTFDVVPGKAVKGAVVSGLKHPIASEPLQWDVTDDVTGKPASIANNGVVGDFQVKETEEGSGIFQLVVMKSGAPALSGTQAISVGLTYDLGEDAEDDSVAVTLGGSINERSPLSFPNAQFEFTIPKSIVAGTPVGAFKVNGGISGEYLDGILTGEGNERFSVRDGDMTLVYRGGEGDPEVGTYALELTVSGDAGLANRTTKVDVKVTVTASNDAPTVVGDFTETLTEDLAGDGLVSAGTSVGDASALINNPDNDKLTYELVAEDSGFFVIDKDTGMVSVGAANIPDSASSADGTDVEYTFQIKVSDGITANDRVIDATVTVDANSPVELVGAAAGGTISLTESVTAGDVPKTLLNLDDLVSDADGNTPVFRVLDDGGQTHIVHQHDGNGDDLLRLTYVPNEADDLVHTVTFGVSDGWNDDPDDPDQTLKITVSVTELEPDPITSSFVGITVVENSKDCSQSGVESGCSLAIVVPTATSFSIESGEDYKAADGSPNYAVADDGTITVLKAPDYEKRLNPAFLVNANNSDGLAGLISVRVSVTDVDEDPVLAAIAGTPWVYETAQIGDPVVEKPADQDGPASSDPAIMLSASDPEGAAIRYSISSSGSVPFKVNPNSGALTVSAELDTEMAGSHSFTVTAADPARNSDSMDITVLVLNANETPIFTSPTGDEAVTTIPEDTGNAHVIFTFKATDEDQDDLEFTLREGQSRDLFVVENVKSEMSDGVEVWSGELHVKPDVTLDYEDAGYDPRVHVEANDPEGLNATLLLTVNLSNVNDNDPAFDEAPATSLSVPENTVRGFEISNYSASDADGDVDGDGVVVSYSLRGADAKSFRINSDGDLMTLESLDADRQVPCGSDGCAVTVVASDGEREATASVRITVTAVEDSVSTLDVSKANPVPGTEMGNPMSALSNAKATVSKDVPEAPSDIPASYGNAPLNFVETAWANWGTVLRIEVTAEAPDATCGNGNQCVYVDVNSDSADDSLKLAAYRADTPAGAASRENHFVAALMLVELSSDATPGDAAVYKHTDGGVPALKVDEEDEVEVKFGNLRDTIDVENEAPEVSNFAPEHERAFDDADVDYTFTITDDHSGLPEPEDLPDNDGDENYTPVVALISKSASGVGQCSVAKTAPKGTDSVLNFAAHIHEDDTLYCPGTAQEGEYVASEGGFGFAPIRDDKDFDEIDNGYDVETTIVLTENDTYYVTFIVCDNAGNCAYHDPDGNDDDEELAQITVDTEDPVFVEARTGLNWDSTDNEYDDDRNYIQVIFNDLTTLNAATVEVDDFVVEGHTIESVTVYENPDDDDVDWGDSDRYAKEGHRNLRHIDRYRDLENAVFIELADELLADETPDVTIVPNGVEDAAGNEQDDGDHEADDWISPKFTIVSITSTLETTQDEVLAGDGDEVTLVVTADERLDTTRPTVTVTYVNAPSGSVDTKGTMSCKVDKNTNGSRDRGEIVLTDYCKDSSAAKGGTLNNSVEKVSNTEWIVTVTEPKDTGYYSFRISGVDRSPQENPGSEGITPDSIVVDFFDSDGDVNTDDAVFWEGDINLANPNVRVSGNVITDNEPDIEYRSPLFVEIDFTANHWSSVDCRGEDDNDNVLANCMNENSEYAEDNFDDIVITMFELDGVDMTDSVKTTDDQTFLVTLENVALGDHTARIQAMDVAGNTLEDVLEIDFEVSDRDPFERRLNPGWNLVSLPGEPADSSIGSVFGPGVEVRTVYTYDPVVPGGWMVAVRETLDSDWQGDLTEITGTRGYWVLSDAIQDWEVSIPRLAGGAAGTGTPIQPPVIALYAGWNLIPVTDISGNGSGGDTVSADVYLQNLDDGLDLARVLGFDTIRNQWYTVLDPDMQMNNTLTVGSGYWIFVREAASLVPSGYISGGGSD